MTIFKKALTPVLGVLLALTLGISIGTAANEVFQGSVYFKKAKILIDGNSVIDTTSGSTGDFTNAHMANRTRYVDLQVGTFHLAADGVPLTAATVPGWVLANGLPALEWAQGESAAIFTTFRVPEDYVSGATFVCTWSLDAASTDTTVDFQVYVNTAAAAYDAAATNQTPVAVTNTTANNVATTLTVATDTFVADDLVTLSVWRAAGTGAGSNLNLLGCRLAYTADM